MHLNILACISKQFIRSYMLTADMFDSHSHYFYKNGILVFKQEQPTWIVLIFWRKKLKKHTWHILSM